MVNNPNFYGQSTTGSPNQIEDGVDFPHTGIIKALADGLGQNYAISGFNITPNSASTISVTTGVIFRDGKRHEVAATSSPLTLGRTTANENSYHLLVASNATSPVLAIIDPSAKDKVPDYTTGTTIIAVVTHNGSNPMPIQYLTVNKTEHSLSVGRDSSGYTEGLTIQSNAGDIEIEAKESDKDIIFKVNDSDGGGAGQEVMRIDAADKRVGIGTNAPSNVLQVVGNTLFGSITGSQGTAPRNLNLVGADAVLRIARTSAFSPALEFLQLSVDGNTRHSYWDIYTDADRFTIRDRESGDINVITILESNQNVGVKTDSPANCFQINHGGSDANNGIMIVRADTTTLDGDLLGGIGFDSTDGNVPSSVLESSAFIASMATENHSSSDKGGNLKFGVSLINENDDTVSTIVANVGQPDTTANATTHAGLNSRATTAVVGATTYTPHIGDSGTLVIFTNASSNLVLPSINNATSVGVQFTVFNETGSAINGQIAVSNSATINGGAASALDDIESFKAATFVCSGNNTWIRIG